MCVYIVNINDKSQGLCEKISDFGEPFKVVVFRCRGWREKGHICVDAIGIRIVAGDIE